VDDKKELTPVIRGIKHWGLSDCSRVLFRIKLGVTGQESSSQPLLAIPPSVMGKVKGQSLLMNFKEIISKSLFK